MKKHCHAVLILAVMVVLPMLQLEAQDENQKDQLWYCWEETVKPELWEEYLELSKEMLEVCKEENFPYPIFTWNHRSMVYELWSPLNSLTEIDSLDAAWMKIIKKWGEEKYEAFTQTKLHNYSKTVTILGDLTYMPENPELTEDERTYGRWIEIYLKPGKQKEFMEAVKELNNQRKAFGIQEYLMLGEGGIGYQAPSFHAYYSHLSQQAFNDYFDSTPEAYNKKFQEYLDKIFKLMIKPPVINHYYLIPELSYNPASQ
jgi:hypothetical protein